MFPTRPQAIPHPTGRAPRRASHRTRPFAIALLGLGTLLSCSTPPNPPLGVETTIHRAQTLRQRAQRYHQSWQRSGAKHYLSLAQRAEQDAILLYWREQRAIGHSSQGFYRLHRLRRASCRTLDTFTNAAQRQGFALPSNPAFAHRACADVNNRS